MLPYPELTLSSKEIAQTHDFIWDIAIFQGGLLLLAENEARIWKSFSGPDESGHWECMLDRPIRRFRNITTIEEYLEKRNPPSSQTITLSGTTRMYNGGSQHTDSPAAVKKRISNEVVNAITDPKIKQFCVELNNTPDENVFSITQSMGEALKWTLWYRAQAIGTSINARDIRLERLLDEAINRPYYPGNAAIRFLKEFKNNFLKTSYDMVRHDPVYIPNNSAVGPTLDVLEHILRETFPMEVTPGIWILVRREATQ